MGSSGFVPKCDLTRLWLAMRAMVVFQHQAPFVNALVGISGCIGLYAFGVPNMILNAVIYAWIGGR